MELTEVVSAHVALPVLGVLICAFLVFAFGFKSPAQPPSFDFDDDLKKKKVKKTKKAQSNGHAVTVGDLSDSNSNARPQQTQASPKQGSKPATIAKQQSPSSKTVTAKQERKNEPVKKTKKPQKNVASPPKEVSATDEEEGWTHISRREKKSRNKKEEKYDSFEERLWDVDTITLDEVVPDVSVKKEPPVQEEKISEVEMPSPQSQRSKKKKKSQKESGELSPAKEETPEKEDSSPPPVEEELKAEPEVKAKSPEEDKPLDEAKAMDKVEDADKTDTEDKADTKADIEDKPDDSTKKGEKGAKPKKLSPEIEALFEEEEFVPIQYPEPPIFTEEVQEVSPAKKKKGKKDKKVVSPAPEPEPAPKLTLEQQLAEVMGEEPAAESTLKLPAPAETKSPKSPKKKKSKKSSEAVSGSKEGTPEVPDVKSVETEPEQSDIPSNKGADLQEAEGATAAVEKTGDSVDKGKGTTEEKSVPAVSTDEPGESWIEAKPKSKKKKPRREN